MSMVWWSGATVLLALVYYHFVMFSVPFILPNTSQRLQTFQFNTSPYLFFDTRHLPQLFHNHSCSYTGTSSVAISQYQVNQFVPISLCTLFLKNQKFCSVNTLLDILELDYNYTSIPLYFDSIFPRNDHFFLLQSSTTRCCPKQRNATIIPSSFAYQELFDYAYNDTVSYLDAWKFYYGNCLSMSLWEQFQNPKPSISLSNMTIEREGLIPIPLSEPLFQYYCFNMSHSQLFNNSNTNVQEQNQTQVYQILVKIGYCVDAHTLQQTTCIYNQKEEFHIFSRLQYRGEFSIGHCNLEQTTYIPHWNLIERYYELADGSITIWTKQMLKRFKGPNKN